MGWDGMGCVIWREKVSKCGYKGRLEGRDVVWIGLGKGGKSETEGEGGGRVCLNSV